MALPHIKDEGIILECSNQSFEQQAVLNPATIKIGGTVHMFYRAIAKDCLSSIGYCQLKNNKVIYRNKTPVIVPEYQYECKGTEDPRLIYLDGTYYLFYVAYDGSDARVTYAISHDLKTFEKRGLVCAQMSYKDTKALFSNNDLDPAPLLCQKSFSGRLLEMYVQEFNAEKKDNAMLWEKDAFLFTEKINDKFIMLLRILPGIQLIFFKDFSELTDDKYWRNYLQRLDRHILMEPRYLFETKCIGAGAPPIKTKDGWLLIYHAVEVTEKGFVYRAAAALLDLERPLKVIGRLKTPLFAPTKDWELKGDVNNVVFPTGTIVEDDKLTIYYGAADKLIAAKSMSLSELVDILKKEGR